MTLALSTPQLHGLAAMVASATDRIADLERVEHTTRASQILAFRAGAIDEFAGAFRLAFGDLDPALDLAITFAPMSMEGIAYAEISYHQSAIVTRSRGAWFVIPLRLDQRPAIERIAIAVAPLTTNIESNRDRLLIALGRVIL